VFFSWQDHSTFEDLPVIGYRGDSYAKGNNSRTPHGTIAAIFYCLSLRILEFLSVILTISSFLILYNLFFCDPFFPDGGELTANPLQDFLAIALFWSIYFGLYVIYMGYAAFSLVVFLVVHFTVGLNPRNISYVNTLPYALHAFPILSGFALGGEPAEPFFWVLYGLIIVFNVFSPRILGEFMRGVS